ncbi:TKL protein kinase [Fonticula alba]|uniref:TKL protein kinase n=1 Tax=Fonticula alba TaxID=691883 RepID=A0A058Z6P6_FONAL|nr:TKL protein kinase [Fonticula alba]KCV69796.1 TKL protein kinase [Fonticula alba]|eukprot:XP_009495402.1 TKL protein kinase [Fonticula alba]
MDTTAGIAAWRHCQAHIVTISAQAIDFRRTVGVGEVLTSSAKIVFAGGLGVAAPPPPPPALMHRAGGLRRGPAHPVAIWVLVNALVLAIGWLGPVVSADEYLYQLPWSMADSSSPMEIGHPIQGDVSAATQFWAHHMLWVYKQEADLGTFTETRLGPIFSATPRHRLQPNVFSDAMQPALLPSQSQLPGAIFQQSDRLIVWQQSSEPVDLVLDSVSRLLASVARADSSSVHLLLESTGLALTLVVADGTAPVTPISMSLPLTLDPTHPLSVVTDGTGDRFFLGISSGVLVATVSPLKEVIQVSQFSEPVERLLSTRLTSVNQLDLVVLSQGGQLDICLDMQSDHTCATTVTGPLPESATPANVHFLNLPPAESLQPAGRLLLVDRATQRLWATHQLVSGAALTWTRIHLPNFFGDWANLRLLHLRVPPSPAGSHRLVVATKMDIFLDHQAMGCGVDPTIMCGPTYNHMYDLLPRGWGCTTFNFLSPLHPSGRLCAGCQPGHTTAMVGATQAPPCQPCVIAGCHSCTTSHCLVCNHDLLLVENPTSGETSCVASCPPGFRQHGQACFPVLSSRKLGLDVVLDPIRELDGTSNNSIAGLARTYLTLENSSLTLTRAMVTARDPTSLLALLPERSTMAIIHNGLGDHANTRALVLTSNPPAGRKLTSLLEMGLTVLPDGHVQLQWFFCQADGSLFSMVLGCDLPPGGGDSCEPSFSQPASITLQGACQQIHPLDESHAVVQTSGGSLLIGLRLQGAAYVTREIPATIGSPVLLPPLAQDSRGPWLLSGFLNSSQLHLMGLVFDADPRLRSLPGPALGLNPFDQGGRPVILPTGRPLHPVEGLFSWLEDGPLGRGTVNWMARVAPLGRAAQGLTDNQASTTLHLAGLSAEDGSRLADQIPHVLVGLSLAGLAASGFPAALLLLTDKEAGVALLHCPPEVDHCRLQPGQMFPLPSGLLWNPPKLQVSLVPPARQAPEAVDPVQAGWTLAASFMVTGMTTFDERYHPLRLSIRASPCDWGSFGPECEPCHGKCLDCDGPGPSDCLLCRYHLPAAPDTCLDACPTGLFSMAPGAPCACHPSCQSCAPPDLDPNGAFYCHACASGYGLPVGVPRPELCLACHANCSECSVAGDPAACTRCRPGLLLHGSQCLDACPPGFWPDDQDTCQLCTAHCQSCLGPTACETCAPQYFLLGDLCARCDGTCAACDRADACLACQPGLIFLQTDPQAGSLCGSMCAPGEYAGPARCTGCHASCSLCAGAAHQCQVCAAGHRWSGAAPAPGATGTCVACPPSCTGCTPSKCLGCEEGLFLTHGGACVGGCPGGTFGDADTGTCQLCDVSCQECAGPTDAHCSACAPGLDPCITCPGDRALHAGACLAACPPGYHARAEAEAGRVCRPCDSSCATCSDASATECTGCMAPKLLHDGACVGACPPGRLACGVSGKCEDCPAGCAACASALEQPGVGCLASCSSCAGGLVLSARDGRCVAACPAGEFTPDARACATCHASCRTCHAAADRCTSCPDARQWLHVDTGVCLSACLAAGQAPSPVEPVCLLCGSRCTRCTAGPGTPACAILPDGSLDCPPADRCDLCAGAHLLHRAECVPECPAGFFADWQAAVPGCRACHPACGKSCSGPDPADCTRSLPKQRLALGLGIGLGVLFCLLAAAGIVVWVLFRRWRRRTRKPSVDGFSEENATVLNTMVELSLPGSILVSITNDFAPLDEQLGAGTQASVFAARAVGAGISDRLGCPATVAIKQLKAARMTPTQFSLFQNEVALMWLLRDAPNVVRLYGYSEQPPALVMERYQTDLSTLLHSEIPLAEPVLLGIVLQWASGLEAMHLQGIAHCDLKPANIFLTRQPDGAWSAALGDLGTSRSLNTDRSTALINQAPELNAMTARYAAPEVLVAFQRRRPLGAESLLAADIYSAAIMLWECLTRSVPWKGLGFDEIIAAVLADRRPDQAALASGGSRIPLATDLLGLAWDSRPHARPMAAAFRQKCAAWLALL